MKIITKLMVILLSAVSLSQGKPAAATYDQRQEGDLNVKVDLENFLILIAKPVSALDVLVAVADMLGDMKRTPSTDILAGQHESIQLTDNSENRSAPDPAKELENVSLDKSDQQLPLPGQSKEEEAGKLVMVVVQDGAEKDGIRGQRNLKIKEVILDKEKIKSIGGKYKIVEAVKEPQNLKLVGDSVENCGPGRSRDRLGICQSDGQQEE